ncbi:hypothetical protein Tco_0040155 [Tanacetum coccineum]
MMMKKSAVVTVVTTADALGKAGMFIYIGEFLTIIANHSSIRCAPFEALYGKLKIGDEIVKRSHADNRANHWNLKFEIEYCCMYHLGKVWYSFWGKKGEERLAPSCDGKWVGKLLVIRRVVVGWGFWLWGFGVGVLEWVRGEGGDGVEGLATVQECGRAWAVGDAGVSFMRILRLREAARMTARIALEFAPEFVYVYAPVLRTASAAAKPCQGDSSEFYLITGNQERYEHVGPIVTSTQDCKRSQDDDYRLHLADDLKKLKITYRVKLKGTSSSHMSKITTSKYKISNKVSKTISWNTRSIGRLLSLRYPISYRLQIQIFYDHVDYTTQMAIDYAAGSPDYTNATLEHELGSMERQVESLMRSEVLLDYEVGFTFLKRPYQKEFEGRILKLIDDKENQFRQLKEDMRKKDTFMCLVDSLIATLKVGIEAQRVHSTKIEKITRLPTHTPSVTPETLKPTMVYRVSMISKIEHTIYRTPHQHLNSNLKMPILHSFEENKLEYKDENKVKIKMIGTRMDKESLEHNLYKNGITLIICHNFSLTSNSPIKPKDSGSFRMKVIFDKEKAESS